MDSVQSIERGRHERWESWSDWARTHVAALLMPLARLAGRLGVHPNTITLLGLLLHVGVGIVFGLGHLRLGGVLLLLVGPVDALDGLLARALNKQSLFGSFLDSTLDRLSDAALILGLTAHYMRQGASTQVWLLLVSLVAVMTVSYIRARAEAVGLTCKIGLLTRMERVLLVGILSALGLPGVMAWALATLSMFTMVQRIVHVYLVSRQEEPDL